MQSADMAAEEMRSGDEGETVPDRFFALDDLRRRRRSLQVAAACYRFGKNGLEFLLVRTRGGRWIFPKGSAEPGLTHAQAAALEAFEEAGVHGRMEEASFIQYSRYKRGSGTEIVVKVYLCQVQRLDRAPEAGRDPTWFSPERAVKKLRDDRGQKHGAELARVIEEAVRRIKKTP